MKKKLISGILLVSLVMSVVGCNKALDSASKNNETKPKIVASYEQISGLKELKDRADTIVEAEGTDNYELVDYKGIKMRKTVIKVIDVIKGDKQLKELKFLQSEGVKGEEPIAKGEKVLMFLKKGVDNPDSYITFGGTQGIYKIVESTSKSNSVTKHLEPHSMVNNKILKELNDNYYDLKEKLRN